MKSVLISIQPRWCELIASGKKTIEVRKTRPKIETPFKCYIYCTNKRPFLVWGDVFRGNWETEFTHLSGYSRKKAERIWDVFNGRVMGEFVCDRIVDCLDVPIEPTCLTVDEWLNYTDGHKGAMYGWHISDLEIYDTPKELSEFRVPCGKFDKDNASCGACEYYYFESNESVGFYDECLCDGMKHAKRPPQSWCYTERVVE